jgi:hypothetical protein
MKLMPGIYSPESNSDRGRGCRAHFYLDSMSTTAAAVTSFAFRIRRSSFCFACFVVFYIFGKLLLDV